MSSDISQRISGASSAGLSGETLLQGQSAAVGQAGEGDRPTWKAAGDWFP